MKGILVKRLESSFYAFKKSVDRFIQSYESFIQMFDEGRILISKSVNVYDLLDEDDEEKIQKMIREEKIKNYQSIDFKPEFKEKLEKDLEESEDMKKKIVNYYEGPKDSNKRSFIKIPIIGSLAVFAGKFFRK